MSGELITRILEREDYDRGFLTTLESLTEVGTISRADFERTFTTLQADPNHFVFVAELDGKVVGSITLLVEQKFIHACGRVGHIEDVVADASVQGKGIGSKLVQKALDQAREAGCYKVILDCSEANTHFYSRFGFEVRELEMRCDLDRDDG